MADRQMAIYLVFLGAPGRNRTYDLRFRKPTLYPLSYGSRQTRLVAVRVMTTSGSR